MARNSKTNKRKQRQIAEASHSSPNGWTRRGVLNSVGVATVGLGVLGAGGAWAVNSFNCAMEERDLTRIGTGRPSVVQIHDPQCPICNALQKETRKALGKLEGEPPIYLIADLTQTEGAIFAQQHRVPHVTLLLFDKDGERVQTLTGSRTRDELVPIFQRHAR